MPQNVPHVRLLIVAMRRVYENRPVLRRRPFGKMVALDLYPIDDQLGQILVCQVASASTKIIEDSEI